MDPLLLCALPILTVLAVYLLWLLRLSVRHTQADERIAYMSRAGIKILGPGWVIANPIFGRLLLVSLNEQTCHPFMDEKATAKVNISYRITDIEKAVDAGTRHGQMRLELSDRPKKEKDKILREGSFIDPLMQNILYMVLVYASFAFKEVPKEYAQDVRQFGKKIDEFCMARLQKRFSDMGIEITHVEIISVI